MKKLVVEIDLEHPFFKQHESWSKFDFWKEECGSMLIEYGEDLAYYIKNEEELRKGIHNTYNNSELATMRLVEEVEE